MAEANQQTDGVVIKCCYDSCVSQKHAILTELETAGIRYSVHILKKNSEEQSLYLLSNIRHTNFILVCCCVHVNSYKNLKKDLRTHSEKVAVVVSYEKQCTFPSQFKQFQVHESTLMIQHLQQILVKSEGDSNEYHPPLLPKRRHIPETEQTIPKKAEQMVPNEKSGIISTDVNSGFINVETFDSDDACNRGTHVLHSACKPKVLIVSSVNEIKRRFNGANQDERENLSKQILSDTIKNLMKDCNFLDLLCLLDIDDSRIQQSVFNVIDTLQLQTNINSRCIMGSDNLKGAKLLIKLCSKWFSNLGVMMRLLSATMDTIAILFLSCGCATYQSSLIPESQNFVESSLPEVNKLVNEAKLTFDSHLQNMLVSVQKVLENLGSTGKKNNILHMGNFRDTLVDEEIRVRMKQKFEKSMTYLEQYAFLIAVINQMLQKPDILFVNYMSELTSILVEKISKKPKLISTTFSQLTLVTKGVVNRLCRGPINQRTTPEYQFSLCKVLNTYLASSKVNQLARKYLLDKAASLLFHENKHVVKNMVYLFQINKYCSKDIREQVSKYIVQQLAIVNFKIDGVLTPESNVRLEPTWLTFAGTVSENHGVVLHVLVPTLHCIAEGSMTDYKHKADQKETMKHLNSLDILKHLQDAKKHMNLIELLAFQCRPLPIFYVTDHSVGHDLNSYLLDSRRVFKWLSQRELITIVADAVDAISFLHSRKVIHRNLTSFAFCMRKQNTIALHDFTLAKVLGNNTGFVSELENTEVPVLWSAPESILEDHYDVKTDTWMIGQFMYEVFTHGCHPYTEVYGASTEQLLEYIVFQHLKPHKWPCIPMEIHKIICQCVSNNPEDRIDITDIGTALNNALVSLHGGRKPRISQVFEEDKKYPELDSTQRYPERGLPPLIKQLKQNNTQDRKEIRKSYFNLRLSQRRNKNELQITETDVRVADKPICQTKFHYVSVFEPVTVEFVHSLPHLDRQTYIDVFHMLDSPTREERRHCQGAACPYLLKYKLRKCDRLLDLAFSRIYKDPETNIGKYIGLVVNILKFVSEMHKRNWILRDLCAENLCVIENKKEVTMARLGRMLWLDNDNVLDDCIIDQIKTDRQRWLPIEVLQNGQYSKEGDIYMVAMVIYEFFTALGIHEDNPMAGYLDCAPFSKLARSELLKTLYSGEVPLNPDYCPDWLYEIMKQCWDRDRTKRPTAESMINQINRTIKSSGKSSPSEHQSVYDTVDSDNEEYDELTNECSGDDRDGEDYEPLKHTPTSNYEALVSSVNRKSIKNDSCPKTNKRSSNNQSDKRKNSTSLSSIDIPFTCANSDSLSCSSLSVGKSEGDDISPRTNYFENDFHCVNSITSESDNDYTNYGSYIDGKTVGNSYENFSPHRKISSSAGEEDIVHVDERFGRVHSDDFCSNGTASTASSTYFSASNLTVFEGSLDQFDETSLSRRGIVEGSIPDQMHDDMPKKWVVHDKLKQKGNKNKKNMKRSRSREKQKLSVWNEGNDEYDQRPAPCRFSKCLNHNSNEELRCISNTNETTHFVEVVQRSCESAASSSYFSCDEHFQQRNSLACLSNACSKFSQKRKGINIDMSQAGNNKSSYPSLPKERTYLDFEHLPKSPHSIPNKFAASIEENCSYTDFERSTNSDIFHPPSNDESEYLTPVYHI